MQQKLFLSGSPILDSGQLFPYHVSHGKDTYTCKLVHQGVRECPPPVHVHVIYPTGKAQVFLGGEVINSGVPETVIKLAVEWVAAHHNEIRAEWERLDNPKERTLP